MKKVILLGILLASSMFVACGDDSSSGTSAGGNCFTVEKSVNACEFISKDDFGTWKFIRKDSFGDDMQYVYTVEGEKLVLTTTDSGCNVKRDEKSYSFYNMTKEASIEMSYMAVVSTCEDGQ